MRVESCVRRSVLVVATVLLAIAWTGCSGPKDFELRSLDLGDLQRMGTAETTVDVNMVLYNPNGYRVQVTSSELGLWLAGDSIGRLTFAPGTALAGKAASEVVLQARLDNDRMGNLLPARWFEFLVQGVPIKVDGPVTGKAWGIRRTIDIHYEERIRLVE